LITFQSACLHCELIYASGPVSRLLLIYIAFVLRRSRHTIYAAARRVSLLIASQPDAGERGAHDKRAAAKMSFTLLLLFYRILADLILFHTLKVLALCFTTTNDMGGPRMSA